MIYDEKLACAIIHGFTKGYGKVPIAVYDTVLPILENETFRQQLLVGTELHHAISIALKDGYTKTILEKNIEKYKDFTSKVLGICMLNKLIEFNIQEGMIHGSSQESTSVVLKEAVYLGKSVSGKSYDAIVQLFNVYQERIVVLDLDTLGKGISITDFKKFGKVDVFDNCKQENIATHIKEATIVITNKKELGKQELQHADALRLICVTATGINNIDTTYCKEKGITVCNVKGYSTNSVAQHTFALLLDLYHKNQYYHQYIASGQYSNNPMFSHFENTFYELEGKNWGIVGMGAIGQRVAKIATLFGCHVQYYSTSSKNKEQPYPCCDFETLVRTSDIISIHAPLNSRTENLFDEAAFALMKSSAYIINVGRGKIINEIALANALQRDQIAGAGLDVFTKEPMDIDNPLLKVSASKIRMTPHIAWATKEARARVIHETQLNIEAFLQGESRNVC